MLLKNGTSSGSDLFLCIEKNIENFKVDLSELVTMINTDFYWDQY